MFEQTLEIRGTQKYILKKRVYILILIMCFLSACNSTEGLQKKTINSQQADAVESQILTIDAEYEKINRVNLKIDSVNLFEKMTEEEIYEYSEKVKGIYAAVLDKESIFPIGLVEMLEEALYHSTNYSPKNFMEDLMRNAYFETIRELGSDDYQLTLEDLYEIFPILLEYKEEIKSISDVYKFIGGPMNLYELFYTDDMVSGGGYYVFVYRSGGSNGVDSVLTAERNNDEFVPLCEFEVQNSGYGSVIRYEDSFYYVFLQYNYNIKVYDGIRVHKLGPQAEKENILIKYLPNKYIWKNVYDSQTNSGIADYIDTIKDTITSSEYLENGRTEGVQVFFGDEIKMKDFPLADDYNEYYKIDFSNVGLPVYIRKSSHIPSDYQSTWHLKTKFYALSSQSNEVMEFKNLEIGRELPHENELVQMWFKEIDNKILTFCVYHISDYNYMLNTLLIEAGEITVVRTDVFSPQREFVLTEGDAFVTN